VSGNKVISKIFGPKRRELSGTVRKLSHEELLHFTLKKKAATSFETLVSYHITTRQPKRSRF